MSDFSTATPEHAALDPAMRVRYAPGMVLGPDDFEQEQAYFIGKNRLHNRLLHGYGTACGLRVTVLDQGGEPLVAVSAGIAVSPQGHEICVPIEQRANLNDWLTRHPEVPQDACAYLVLAYKECETEPVPIPGGPCRPQEDSTAPSRIADDFRLALEPLPAPGRAEEEAAVGLGNLLSRIAIEDSSPPTSVADLEAYVRALAEPPASALTPLPGSLPIGSAEATDVVHALFRVWVTEVVPRLHAAAGGSLAGKPTEPRIPLATLRFTLGDDRRVDGAVTVDERERPLLLSTRALQELLRLQAPTRSWPFVEQCTNSTRGPARST